MSPDALKKRIEALAPGTVVRIVDLTGTEDHYEAHVVSSAFAGKSLVEQHQMVYALLQPEMMSGEVHALSLKTKSS